MTEKGTPPIAEHLKPYEWSEKLEEQTITIVVNKKFDHPREVIECIEDYNKVNFTYVENEGKTYDDLFNTHDDDVFKIGCRQVAPHVFVLVENNGYYANQEENIVKLSSGGDKDPDAVAFSIFWNVNARYYLYVGSAGKVILALDPFDVPGDGMLDNNEASVENFDQVWKWGDVFHKENFQNCGHIISSMLWLAEKVTGYKHTEDFYNTPLEHYGVIGTKKKRRTEEGESVMKLASQDPASDASPTQANEEAAKSSLAATPETCSSGDVDIGHDHVVETKKTEETSVSQPAGEEQATS